MTGKRYIFALLSLFVSLLAIYSNSFDGQWQYDDFANIVDNPDVDLEGWSWSGVVNVLAGTKGPPQQHRRPLAYLTFALNHAVGGLSVFGYHVVNFLVHYLTAVILFVFILKSLFLADTFSSSESTRYHIALLSALLWATHPIHVTAVTYIVQRMASMAALFYLLAMLFYLKGRTTRQPARRFFWFGGCALAGICSVATKENALMLPFSIVMSEMLILTPAAHPASRRLRIALALLLTGVVIVSVFYVNIESILKGYARRPFTLSERLMTQPRVLFVYLGLLIYPSSQRFTLLHDIEPSSGLLTPWTTLPAMAGIAIVLLMTVRTSRRYPFPAFCVLFFFLNHAIEGSLIPLEMIYEHRNYLPSMLLFPLVVTMGLIARQRFTPSRTVLTCAAALLVGFLIAQSHTVYLRNRLFRDEVRFWQDNVIKSPRLSAPYLNLGQALWNRGRVDEAMAAYRTAQSLDRFHSTTQVAILNYNLGLYEARVTGDADLALTHFLAALSQDRGHPEIWRETAVIMYTKGETEKADAFLSKALEYWPENGKLLELRRRAPKLQR